jgi:hypothetical protein
VSPREVTDLSSLRVVTSTGMVLSDALFEWFYDTGFPAHVCLANISGGTDLAGCFATENALLPVYVGGCSGPSLGVPVAVYDQVLEGGKGFKGTEVEDGVPGELVATKAFPNMPVTFWGERGDERYWEAYFGKYDGEFPTLRLSFLPICHLSIAPSVSGFSPSPFPNLALSIVPSTPILYPSFLPDLYPFALSNLSLLPCAFPPCPIGPFFPLS